MERLDLNDGEAVLVELTGIQFGLLTDDDTLSLSVFERNQPIEKAKDLWNSRLGVYTLLGHDGRCGTCGARKASDCDGHFGHIKLPMAVYHPLHVRFLKKVLSQICLVCLRIKEKNEQKAIRVLNDEEAEERQQMHQSGVGGKPVKGVKPPGRRFDYNTESTEEAEVFNGPQAQNQSRKGAKSMGTKEYSLKNNWTLDTERLADRVHSLKSFRGVNDPQARDQSRNEAESLGTKASSLKSKWTLDTEKLANRVHSLKTLSGVEVKTLATNHSPMPRVQDEDGRASAGKLQFQSNVTKSQKKYLMKDTDAFEEEVIIAQLSKTQSRLAPAYKGIRSIPIVDLSSDEDTSTPLGSSKTPMRVPHRQKVNGAITAAGHKIIDVDDCDSSVLSDCEAGCKYCGAGLGDSAKKFPDLVLTLVKREEHNVMYETIEMKVGRKDEVVPPDFWNFVDGNPGSCNNIRPLFPFEALLIMRRLSEEVIGRLGMHAVVAQPEALILCTLPVPPSNGRIKAHDTFSSLPEAHMDQQHRLLQRMSTEVKRLQSSRSGKPKFPVVKSEVMELQCLASCYLAGSKWEHGLQPNRLDPEVKNQDKFMKGHVLAKRNNVSARLIVIGDPSIQIEEILVPLDLVEYLTIPEKVTTLNAKRLQEYVDNGPYAQFPKTGAVRYQRSGSPAWSLFSVSSTQVSLEVGDTVHRHLKDGDLIIVNRPPSLTKHSLMAMRVRLHPGSAFAINPLICAPFQADFDGDTLHVFVPQSLESMAEVHELLNVPDQLLNQQCGQSNSGLTEDSRLGAHLITGSFLFLDQEQMSQLIISNCVSLPIPAILKSPRGRGPVWTGHQLYSTTLPAEANYQMDPKKYCKDMRKGIVIKNGEILVCDGSSHWLDTGYDSLVVCLSKSLRPTVALKYLNNAQILANLYLGHHGFSVGLRDYQLASDHLSRGKMLNRMKEVVARANREALLKTIISDEQVQRRELERHPANTRAYTVDTDCGRSTGLYFGHVGVSKKVTTMDKLAISGFQHKFDQMIKCLVKKYSSPDNALLVMVKAGSKGSMIKMTQQTLSLGLQLYKGDHLLSCKPRSLPCQGQFLRMSKITDLLQVEQGAPLADLAGYWESRGIISRSYLDGLCPLQFFIHNYVSRYGIQRAGVEEPNLLLKRLLLFTRDICLGYDGSVRNIRGGQIVQFEYGGLLEVEDKTGSFQSQRGPDDWLQAGEAVGILAATAVTEPAYQLKLDSPHMVGPKAIGPLELFNETLSSNTSLKAVDRRVLLRLPRALIHRRHGQEKGVLKIQEHLRPLSLGLVASSTIIKYQKVRKRGDSNASRRLSPWVGHIHLSTERLTLHQVSLEEVVLRLEKKYASRNSNRLIFSSSAVCQASSGIVRQDFEPCIQFFPDISTFVAACKDNEYEDHMVALLETMKDFMIPTLLNTIVKGDERISCVSILWEDKAWNPRLMKHSSRDIYEEGSGELVVEATVKAKHCKLRGAAWEIVKESCQQIYELLDWRRCTPYSVQEVSHVLGVDAAQGVLLQRLELAVAGMGKAVRLEHLQLIADSVTTCGEVHGACSSGYKQLCRSTSIHTPFSNAAFGNPKNVFLAASRLGVSEDMGGAIASSVWGKLAPLGTGSGFDLLWQGKKPRKEGGREMQVEGQPLTNLQKGIDAHHYATQLSCSRAGLQPPSVPAVDGEGTVADAHQRRPSAQPLFLPTFASIDGSNYFVKSRSKESLQQKLPVLLKQDVKISNNNPEMTPSLPQTNPDILQCFGKGKEIAKLCNAELVKGHKLLADEGQSSKRYAIEMQSHIASKTLGVHANRCSANHEQVSKPKDSNFKLEVLSDLSAEVPSFSPVSIEKKALARRKGASDESTPSFHTPRETLDVHSNSSSPRSSSVPPNASSFIGGDASDQMSGICQPSTAVSQIEAVATLSYTATEHAIQTLSLPSKHVRHKEWLIEERSSTGLLNSPLLHTDKEIATSMATHSDPEAQSETANEDLEKLLRLVRFIKYTLHRKYEIGEMLGERDQRFIVDKVLRFHPDYEQKVGCGLHFLKVDCHQVHLSSRCFYIVRLDKTTCDFSYHKCIRCIANAVSPVLAAQYDRSALFKGKTHELELEIPEVMHFEASPTRSLLSSLLAMDEVNDGFPSVVKLQRYDALAGSDTLNEQDENLDIEISELISKITAAPANEVT